MSDQDRDLAYRLLFRASILLAENNAHIATRLTRDAADLLDLSGSRETEPGIWLLEMQGELHRACGDYEAAETRFRQALALSVKLSGEDGAHAMICAHNLADFLNEIGKQDEAYELNERAARLGLVIQPQGSFTAEYLSEARSEIAKLRIQTTPESKVKDILTKKFLVRAYLTDTVYAYRWASSPEEQTTIAAEYARERQARHNGRYRTYLRITLVTYTTDEAGKETESETVAYVRDNTDWRRPVLVPAA